MPRPTLRPLLPALTLLTLILAACGQTTTATAPVTDPVLSSTQASVTLRLPAPQSLSAQYINQSKTTRLDVQIDGGAATSYTLGSAQAPCSGGFCTVTLTNVPPGSHTFTFGTYGFKPKPSDGTTVLISQGSVTQMLTAGQRTNVALTLTPVNATATLSSAVKQYNRVTKAFGNYVQFAAAGGRSLPAYYDVQGTDSVGDPLPTVLCGGDASVAITNISDAVHANRFRVEVQTLGAHTLNVQSGSSCIAGGTALASQTVSGLRNAVSIAGETYHSLAVLTDGTVRAWGDNSSGQLGDGSTTDSSTPVPVSGLRNAVSIAGGNRHSLALLADGTVRTWGDNAFGQLGDGTTTDRYTPVPVSGLSDAVSIAGGSFHGLALLADGTVRAWGDNSSGQLGDGSTTNRSSPVPVSGLRNAVSIAGGTYHSLAVLTDGTVRAWGDNSSAQLGDGSTTDSSAPVPVSGLRNAVSIAGGTDHSLALLADGTVRAWGQNSSGQLGDGSTTDSSTPVPVSGLRNAVSIAGGGFHGLALLADGTVRAWGYNGSGQLGDGTTASRSTPVPVSGLSGAVSIAGGTDHSLALLADGTVRAWGYNGDGQLGDGSATSRSTPVPVSGLSTVAQPAP
ncbi:RCC1 domain-containing protein [Deinococcus sp. UYEF24]